MTTGVDSDTRLALLLRDRNLYLIFCVTLMAVLGVSSITPAFPAVIEHFGLHGAEVGLLITAFTLPGVFLTLPLGVVADRYGRKRVLVPALLLFGVAGGACALATSYAGLLVLRFLHGVGAAALASINVTLIGDLYSGRRRLTVMGYNATVLSIGTASYPALGGALALFGWRYPFALALLSLPLGVWVLLGLHNPEPVRSESFAEYFRGAMRVLSNRHVTLLFFASIATFTILYGSYLTFMPLLIHEQLGASSLVIGLVMSVSSVASGVTSLFLPNLNRRFRQSTLIHLGFACYVVAMSVVPWADTVWKLVVPTAAFGIGMGLNVPSIMNLLSGAAPLAYRGVVMALNGMAMRLGQTFGPLLVGLAFAVAGFTGVFYAGALIAVGALVLLLVALPREARES